MTRKSLAILLAFICLIIRLKYLYGRTLVPFQLDYEEGNILNAALRLLHGATPYPDPRTFPYILNPYGPAGYALTALGIKTFGLSLFGPRLFVLLAGVGIAVLIAALTRSFTGQWKIGLLLGALYLCLPQTWDWLPILRVDFWAVFFSLLGLYLFTSFPRAWYLPAIVFALALLTKQTAIAAPLACMADLIVQRKLKRALAFGTILAGAILTCLLPMDGHYAFHLIYTHPDPYSIQRAWHYFSDAIKAGALIVIIIVYAASQGFRWNRQSRSTWLYLGFCTPLVLTAGKLGSNSNHVLEWMAALCLMGALALSYLLEKPVRFARPLAAGVLLLFVALAVLPQFSASSRIDQSECADAYAFVRSFPGHRILSEDVSALVLGGQPVLVSNPFVATQLGNSVAWSQGTVDQLVERQYFDLIVLGGELKDFQDSGRWSSKLIEAVGQAYTPAKRFRCSPNFGVAYVPKQKAGAVVQQRAPAVDPGVH